MTRQSSWGNIFEETYLKDAPADQAEERQILNLDDRSRTYVCRLWEGVYLWGNEVGSRYIDYHGQNLDRWDYAVINLCHVGRCEVELQDGTYIYMVPGLLNVNDQIPRNGYMYPYASYEGIELALDQDILKKRFPAELSSYGLTMEALDGYLQRGAGNFMARVAETALRYSRELYDRLKAGDAGLTDYRFWTLSLLYHIKNGAAYVLDRPGLVTKGQRRIAVEVERLLTADYRRRYSIEELSHQYGISPSALKKYFGAVFGSPISYYVREKRMGLARELLEGTDLSVGEAAAMCGYENQGKFSGAFKAHAGVSPLEYRRLHRKAQAQEGA